MVMRPEGGRILIFSNVHLEYTFSLIQRLSCGNQIQIVYLVVHIFMHCLGDFEDFASGQIVYEIIMVRLANVGWFCHRNCAHTFLKSIR